MDNSIEPAKAPESSPDRPVPSAWHNGRAKAEGYERRAVNGGAATEQTRDTAAGLDELEQMSNAGEVGEPEPEHHREDSWRDWPVHRVAVRRRAMATGPQEEGAQ